jgi:hypothetical protein
MSVIKFELKEDHLKLLKHLEWEKDFNGEVIVTSGENPFGGFDHYEDMGVILYGKPDNFDPLEPIEGNPFIWTDEQREEMDKLLSELPMALDVVLYTQSFEIGKYKTKFHDKNWKKIK